MLGVIKQWYKGYNNESTNVWLPDSGKSIPVMNLILESFVDPDELQWVSCEDSPAPDIEILRWTAFKDFLASDEIIKKFEL